MQYILIGFFLVFGFMIFWAMIGFPLSMKLLKKKANRIEHKKDYDYCPSVTVMIVAHNEEDVIKEKLENIMAIDYPSKNLEILVSSDNSDDDTNAIVKKAIEDHPEYNIRLYEVKERKGKTNAQNEAANTVTSEILVMTDANAMLAQNAIKELVSMLAFDEVAYVTGRLTYVSSDNWTAQAENRYWEMDLKLREIESKLYSITAGNGALYAVKTKEYVHFDPVRGHDGAMPPYYVKQGKRAYFNKDALVYERAGQNVEDEFKRKVRMARNPLKSFFPKIALLNLFRFKWFSYFYFGHRYCRRNLWFAHIVVLITSALLIMYDQLFIAVIALQVTFYLLALIRHFFTVNLKPFNMIYYYSITILAQLVAVYKQLSGQTKPFWEKAESTRKF